MNALRLIPVYIASLLLAAHFLRALNPGLAATCVLAPLLLIIPRLWVARIYQIGLVGAAAVWVSTAIDLARIRMALGAPYLRMAIILGAVALVTGGAALVFRLRSLRTRYSKGSRTAAASTAAFVSTALLLAVVQVRVEIPALLTERFLVGGGWIAVLGLASWAAWLTEAMLDSRRQAAWRRKAWGIFSTVFFAQLALGLLGLDRFLMTGELHLPVPALIAAGPIFRGEGLFMPILFGATVLLVGPAWCSHLCYIGAWDSGIASSRRLPRALPRYARWIRAGILVAVLAAAALLRALGAPNVVAGGLALGFGLAGVVVMLAFTRATGTMVHCTVFCPIGLVADLLGKLSPFRIRIGSGCTACGKCGRVCRYDALSPQDIERKRPALTCTLCGDCVGPCKHGAIGYRFPGLTPDRARTVFIVLVVSLHAAFLGVARI
jgi:ferredoxin